MDLVCLGWNNVIGTGLFLAQGAVAGAAGSWGPALFLLGGLACWPIALCFGQLARRYPGTGGASLYADRVFGARPGFVLACVMWFSGLVGGASVARALGDQLARLAGGPELGREWGSAVVLAFAALNALGTRSGASGVNVLAVAKLLPLGLACLVGALWVGPAGIAWPPLPLDHPNLGLACLLVLYAYSGFEEIALPAGEVRDAERAVSRATLAVLASSALLYALLQGAVCSLGGVGTPQPLVTAFRALPPLSAALGVAMLVSFASVNASIAFTTPRSLWTLAHLGWLPLRLTRVWRGAPLLCVAISCGLTLCFIWFQALQQLIVLSVLASLLQQGCAALACWKLRGWGSRPGVPQLASLVCLGLLCTSELATLKWTAAALAGLAGLSLVARQRQPHVIDSTEVKC